MKLHSHARKHTALWAFGLSRSTTGLVVHLGRVHLHVGGVR